MNVASIRRPMSASFIEGKSANFWVSNTVPLRLCCVIQLVTGHVRWQVTGRKPTVKCSRASPEAGVAAAGTPGMYWRDRLRWVWAAKSPRSRAAATTRILPFMVPAVPSIEAWKVVLVPTRVARRSRRGGSPAARRPGRCSRPASFRRSLSSRRRRRRDRPSRVVWAARRRRSLPSGQCAIPARMATAGSSNLFANSSPRS